MVATNIDGKLTKISEDAQKSARRGRANRKHEADHDRVSGTLADIVHIGRGGERTEEDLAGEGRAGGYDIGELLWYGQPPPAYGHPVPHVEDGRPRTAEVVRAQPAVLDPGDVAGRQRCLDLAVDGEGVHRVRVGCPHRRNGLARLAVGLPTAAGTR